MIKEGHVDGFDIPWKVMTQPGSYRVTYTASKVGNCKKTGLVRIAEIAKRRPKERFTDFIAKQFFGAFSRVRYKITDNPFYEHYGNNTSFT